MGMFPDAMSNYKLLTSIGAAVFRTPSVRSFSMLSRFKGSSAIDKMEAMDIDTLELICPVAMSLVSISASPTHRLHDIRKSIRETILMTDSAARVASTDYGSATEGNAMDGGFHNEPMSPIHVRFPLNFCAVYHRIC